MSERPEILNIVRKWVERAQEDFDSAKFMLELGDRCPVNTVCFHA